MITRSQSRRNNVIQEIKMADSNEMSEEFEINNQLGVEHGENSDNNLEIGAGGLNSDTSINMLQIIVEQINKKFDEVNKSNEELNEQNNKLYEETINLISNKIDSTTQKLEKLIHVEVGAVRASLE
jgi:ABC-type Zn uptake system ZnuABC Zn-binding protein ZnuA